MFVPAGFASRFGCVPRCRGTAGSHESGGLVVRKEACQLGLLILVNEELRETGAELASRRLNGEVMCSCG